MFVKRVHYLARVGDNAAHASEVMDGNFTFDSQFDIFDHLAGIQFDGEYALCLFRQPFDFLVGERPQSYGADKADLMPCDLASSIVFRHILATDPKATMRYSASSV